MARPGQSLVTVWVPTPVLVAARRVVGARGVSEFVRRSLEEVGSGGGDAGGGNRKWVSNFLNEEE